MPRRTRRSATPADVDWELHDELDVGRSAQEHMATDVAMLDRVLDGGPPMLRLYQWRPTALTIGRHQDVGDVDEERCRRFGVEVARRPTGGRALLHGGDLTYAVAMRVPEGIHGVLAAYSYLADALIAGLARLGVAAAVAQRAGERGVACFASAEGADVAVAGRKVCGSAQLQQRGGLLQHGAVLLERLPVSEPDLLVYRDPQRRRIEQERLRSATVTLAELGAQASVRPVADALIEGFRAACGARFTSAEPLVAASNALGSHEGIAAPSLSA